jgi:kynureninase
MLAGKKIIVGVSGSIAAYKSALFVRLLAKEGVVVDWREPDIIRMAPVPMYNSFQDIYSFGKVMERIYGVS